jgi:predicted metal-binding membrane protein
VLSAFDTGASARRDRVLIASCIAALTALSWIYLVRLERDMCLRMPEAPTAGAVALAVDLYWTPADRWLNFTMWAVMMVGMMAPSAAPVVTLFAGARSRKGGQPWAAVLLFSLGYVVVWTLFSALATFAQWGLHQKAMLSAMMTVASPRLAGVILIAAGVYQLTPWKGRCLSHCRSPLGFLLSHWRDGNAGALRMGFGHGVYCLGCCWALMCVLFSVGVMNLAWVAALTAFVFLEKVGPVGVKVARAAGVGLVILGVAKSFLGA